VKTIFAVDDSDTNLALAEEALESHYRVLPMPSAAKMFTFLEKVMPDLILLDIEMPEMDGLDALRILKTNCLYAGIPVIFLTGRIDAQVEAHGFELGAIDFITKPFSPLVLLRRIKTHLDIDELIRERTSHLKRLQNGLVHVLSDMVENRDEQTGGHIERTTRYIKILIKAMLERGLYIDELHSWDMETTNSSARLHDVGKIIIPDIILNKPSALTDKEFEVMKSHVVEGERIIDRVIERIGEMDFLKIAKLYVGYHHERWDGTGYPRGLKEKDIPLQGRIMAVADVYDALVSKRPYKQPLPDDQAVNIITSEAGKYFDPKIVEVFLEVKDLFREVSMDLGQTG
jgi:putative two-component system response regulator